MTKQTFTVGQVLTAAQMTSLQQTAMGGGSTTAKTASYVLVAADAGTVVQMNAAGATTITVNTALFAAGDTVQIQNVGAGVCTVTAGTATVSTSATLALKQYDAGSLYFNTTSAAIFFAVDAADGMANPLTTTGDMVYSSSGTTAARLGIGSSAQVLTVASGIPSWATPASGGGMTLLSTTTLSGTSTTISSISTAYINLFILYERVTQNTTGGYLRVNCNAATYSQYDGVKNGNGTAFVNSGAQTFFAPLGTNTPNSGYETFGQITIYNYATTTTNSGKTILTTGATYAGAAGPGVVINTAYLDSAVAISSLKFDFSNGGTISGTVKIYGVN